MNLEKNLYHYLVVLLLLGTLLTTGCYKFSGTQTIPAYISISGVYIDTDYPLQGTSSSNVSDVWIYVDDKLIGVFEIDKEDSLGAVIPVLAEGKHKLEIRPGIKLNGISSTRVPYIFYKPIIYEKFDFIPGTKVQELGKLKTEYYPNVEFVWMEDFEDADISIKETTWSDTIIERTMPENNPIAFLSPNSRYSGEINITTEKPQYAGTTHNSFAVPKPGTIVMLEMNFKTTNYLVVGLLIRDAYEVKSVDLVILNHSSIWKKIYINLGSNLSLYPKAIDYKVILKSGLESDRTSSQVLIDNFKIIQRK